MLALLRMRRVQMIMQAVRTHQKITSRAVSSGRRVSKLYGSAARSLVQKKIVEIKGRIATSRKRSRDLWRGKRSKRQ